MGQTLSDQYSSSSEFYEYQDNNIDSIFQNDPILKVNNLYFIENNDKDNLEIFSPYFSQEGPVNSKINEDSNNIINNEISNPSRDTLSHSDNEVSNKSKIFFDVKKKGEKKICGRKRQRTDNIYYKPHTKDSPDNILRKINVGYLKFIISFLNSLIKYLNLGVNKKCEFKKFYYEYIKVINQNRLLENTSKTIGQLIKDMPISTKYKLSKESDKEHNKNLVQHYSENSEIMKNILDGNFLSLFPIYYNSERKVNLSKFGQNVDFILSEKVKLYKDLIEKSDNGNEDYKKICQEIIKSQFLSK